MTDLTAPLVAAHRDQTVVVRHGIAEVRLQGAKGCELGLGAIAGERLFRRRGLAGAGREKQGEAQQGQGTRMHGHVLVTGTGHCVGLEPPALVALRPSFSPRLLVKRPALRASYNGHYLDRKSTRLNSSHVKISYAVFCLKKKR